MIILYLLTPLILAFCYRSGGHIHPWGTQVNRVVSWAIPVGIFCIDLANTYHLPLWLGIPCFFLAWVGHAVGHSSSEGESIMEYEHMGIIVGTMNAAILLPFLFYGLTYPQFLVILPLGYVMGVLASWLGYNYQFNLTILGFNWTNTGNNSTCEEFYIGGLVFGLTISILGVLGTFSAL